LFLKKETSEIGEIQEQKNEGRATVYFFKIASSERIHRTEQVLQETEEAFFKSSLKRQKTTFFLGSTNLETLQEWYQKISFISPRH